MIVEVKYLVGKQTGFLAVYMHHWGFQKPTICRAIWPASTAFASDTTWHSLRLRNQVICRLENCR
jgi:hypothetical protein